MEENNSFKPYVSADKVLPEFTPSSIIIGVLLAMCTWSGQCLLRASCRYDGFSVYSCSSYWHGGV